MDTNMLGLSKYLGFSFNASNFLQFANLSQDPSKYVEVSRVRGTFSQFWYHAPPILS